MIGIPVGLAVANAAEWWIHKHILHGKGRDRNSFWSFHDQDANWCVTKPWFDTVMGTRKPYVGTPDEQRDQQARQRDTARTQAAG